MSDPRWTVDKDGRLNITLPSTDVILCGPDALGYMPVDWYDALVECVRSHDTLTRTHEPMEAALRSLVTVCRECRDEMPVFSTNVPRAEFILWGKLFPSEALGPKCYDHAVKYVGHHVGYRASQYAVVDLRPVYAALDLLTGEGQ